MFLIMSAAYIDQELKSEFGQIPPSLLPLGNRRLFQHQIKCAPEGVQIYLSLPETYNIIDIDWQWLQKNNVKIVRTPDNLSLGAALVAALNLIDERIDNPLHVLFGDTLINPLPNGDDIVAISDVKDSYNWAVVTNDDMKWFDDSDNKLEVDSNNVVSGYFKFSQPRQLVKCITQSHWNFLDGLNRYHAEVGLSSVKINNWLDFGHVKTYYRSKVSFTTQRAFNDLKITPTYIEKSSIKNQKIKAEANWFNSIPNMLRGYTPQYLGSEQYDSSFSYRLEYLHQTALNELFVFGELPSIIWKQIFNSCFEFIDTCMMYEAPVGEKTNNLDELFGVKTSERLNDFCLKNDIDISRTWIFNKHLQASLQEIVSYSENYLPKNEIKKTVLHGDLCFSNLLYDFRTSRVKVIDPRGLTQLGELTIYGDIRYDLAKLSHSVLGMYDWIIAGYYSVVVKDYSIDFEVAGLKDHKKSQQIFVDMISDKYGISALNLYAMQIQLFLSMLPLHSDEPKRQQALMANAFRIYDLMKRLEK
ncbi:capsular biosynthesis protein [Photobacterium rosenbergii]|uniref:capsular biosynthesis protein n=1 Tax=Photobacterium rosenbergii TaxID=294936 RepID=UPI001C991138|nr:capsular biosynthesis protein [Photobacterium rosenbergii]MBY5947410.1 capsular biosynthesis protein [Photobacterium rosenbergii]